MKLLSLIVPTKEQFDNSIIKILNSPDYSNLRGGISDFIDNLKASVSDWLLRLLKKVFNNIDTASKVSEKLSSVFVILGILIIAALIIVIVVRINKNFERDRRVREILGEKIDDKTTPASLRNKAQDCIRSGDYRRAVRYDFIALLLLMHEYNAVYLDETKTNEEIYRYLIHSGFSGTEEFKFLKDDFNAVWYGHKEYEEENYKNWKANIEVIWSEVIKYEAQKA